MYLPTQAPPVHRNRRFAPVAGVRPQQPANTCDCSGDCNYNQCSVTRNGCDPGFYPVCNCGPYNCGCQCTPAN
jgi:hypothetical protein